MSEGVVADDMSALRNFGGDVRTLAHVASDHEECCANVMPGEYVEQMQSVGIVRAIIEGERNLLCCAIPAAKIPAKPLPCGRHGLVGGNAGADKHANSKAEHGGIVNGGRNASKKACRKSLLHGYFFGWCVTVNFFLNCATAALGIFSNAISSSSWPSSSIFPDTLQLKDPYESARARSQRFSPSGSMHSE